MARPKKASAEQAPTVDPTKPEPGAPAVDPSLPPPQDLSQAGAENGDDTAPETAPETAAPGEAPRKRGRPPGSGKGKPAAEKSASRKAQDTAALAHQIKGLHSLAAMATGLQIMQISDQEATILAAGVNAVCEEYGFALTGKTGAALQLFAAAAMVYAPRIMYLQAEKAKQKAADNPNVPEAAPNMALVPAGVGDGATTLN